MNPYTFVPLTEPPARERPTGHDRYHGHSGELECRLTARTPVFVYDPRFAQAAEQPAGPGHEAADFPIDASGQPIVWATALRGALRSVTEAASRSCLSLFDGHYERWTVDYRPRLPATYLRCDAGGPLCPACRLFGAVGALQGGFAGSVRIGDATAASGAARLGERITVSAIQSPKPHHQAFYLTPDGGIAGRKFYYHQPSGPTATIERSRFTRSVQPLTAGSDLTFGVGYRSLSDDDLQLLIYTLLLEPGLGHKIGMGKPVGLGSVTIELTSVRNLTSRAAALGRPTAVLTGEALREWSDALLQPLRAASSPALSALRDVLALDPGRPIAYPTADWFRSHPTAPLSEVLDIQPAPTAPQRAPERMPQREAAERPSRPLMRAGQPFERRDADSARRGPAPERRGAAPARPAGRSRAFEPRPSGATDFTEASEYTPVEPPRTSTSEQPAPEPVAETRPASLEDLVRRFSRPPERPAHAEPAATKESQRARAEQRRLMERLRRREE